MRNRALNDELDDLLREAVADLVDKYRREIAEGVTVRGLLALNLGVLVDRAHCVVLVTDQD